MSTFFPTDQFKCIDLKEFYINKYIFNISKGCVLEVDLEYSKELREMHDYPLAPDTIEIKKEMLSKHKLMISDFYNIPFGHVKKITPNFIDAEKYVLHMRTCNFI